MKMDKGINSVRVVFGRGINCQFKKIHQVELCKKYMSQMPQIILTKIRVLPNLTVKKLPLTVKHFAVS